MAVNKVVMNTENGEQILVDLTGDSVTPETLAEGATAHDASGNMIVGEMQATTPTTAVLYTEQTLTDAQKAQARKNIGIVGGGSGDNIIVDAELSETSENPIQNKAVAEALKNISVDITVDSELSLDSENPVQNKVVTQEFKAFNEAIGDTNRRVSALEQGGVGGGVSSWNDLTDKPFGEEADGTVKQLDNKYLSILDHEAASENVLLPSYTGTNTYLELNGGISAFMLIPEATQEIYEAWATNGDDVTVIYDGETYICPIQEIQGMKAAGNLSSMGGSGNGEPFVLAVIQESADVYMWLIISTVDMTPTEHTVRVYQGVPEKWTIKESCLPFNAIAAYINNYIDEALGGDY